MFVCYVCTYDSKNDELGLVWYLFSDQLGYNVVLW